MGMWKGVCRNYRRLVAFLLIAVMVGLNVGGNLGTAFAAGENENALFLMDGRELHEAVREAVEQGEKFDFASLGLEAGKKSIKNQYEKLLGTKKGDVYQLDVDIDTGYAPEGTAVQVFYHAGTKEVVFLFLNESNLVVDYRVNISGYEAGSVTVRPNTANMEAEDEEELSRGENYEAADMIDDTKKKVSAEVVTPEADEEDKELSLPEEGAAAEETVYTEENTQETEETESREEISEEADTSDSSEAVEEAGQGTEPEQEAETEPETEEKQEENAKSEEILGISDHLTVMVGISAGISEDGGSEAGEPEVAAGTETVSKKENSNEDDSKDDSDIPVILGETESEMTEAEAGPGKTESESEPTENESDLENEGEPKEEADPGTTESEAGSAGENKPEETEAGIPDNENPSEESTADDEESDNLESTEASGGVEGPAEEGPSVGDAVEEENVTETATEQPSAAENTDTDNKKTEESIIKNEDEQLLEDDSIENHGGLDGAALDTVTIWGNVNARAYRVKLEDIPEPEEDALDKTGNEIPPEVQEFLDAVAALPEISAITAENAEEIGEQVNDVINMWENLDEEFSEREDVMDAMDTVYAVFEAVLDAEGMEAGRPLLAGIPGFTPADRFYDGNGKDLFLLAFFVTTTITPLEALTP